MGRPEKMISSYESAAGGFCCRMRGARERAGNPHYRAMSAECGVSYSTLSKAASGNHVPTWPVLAAFISSLNALSTAEVKEDLDDWFERWRKAKEREDTEHLTPLRRRRARHARPSEPSVVLLAAAPSRAVTPEDFVRQLKILRAWSGLSYVQLSRRTRTFPLPTSTISDTLRRHTLPKWSFVEAFILACGGRKADVVAWQNAWRLIKINKLLEDAPTPDAGVRLVEQAMNLDSDEAVEQVAQAVTHLRRSPSVPLQQPAWLRRAVEDREFTVDELLTTSFASLRDASELTEYDSYLPEERFN
ncbi:helix-turn-helix domain-containing protein [Streptomyces lunaelactis]|uniref:helix-turn-helix domain-containing protein n=1 Tax=Streptomyces lunaelactis TaxID=1535768 RepID=UPI0015859F71|nr:helix-turn-helix transcriptional regulator [Streptomyces lunaelactis]NUL14852.1 helix-turn-helix domain-containing protein [Streptomyces lunaelactis]